MVHFTYINTYVRAKRDSKGTKKSKYKALTFNKYGILTICSEKIICKSFVSSKK